MQGQNLSVFEGRPIYGNCLLLQQHITIFFLTQSQLRNWDEQWDTQLTHDSPTPGSLRELADSIRLERRGRFLYASPSDRMETYFENRSGYCKRYLENGSTHTSVNSYNYTSSENVSPKGKKQVEITNTILYLRERIPTLYTRITSCRLFSPLWYLLVKDQ